MPATLARLCSQLVLNLQFHFDAEEQLGALPTVQHLTPYQQAEVKRLSAAHEELLAQGRRLLRVALQEGGRPAWHRELNRAFTRLRDQFYANELAEMQFVQRAYGLDVRETD